jgi:hypothetical protein
VARSLAAREIVSWAELTNEAACASALYVTPEVGMNPLPFIVSVSEPVPAGAEAGDKLEIDGCGLPGSQLVKARPTLGSKTIPSPGKRSP